MGSLNIQRLLEAAEGGAESVVFSLQDDERFGIGGTTGGDVYLRWDSTDSILEFLPETDDTGAFNIGDGTYDMDFKVFLGATTKYVVMDKGDALLKLEDVDLHLGDDDSIELGDATGGDAAMKWNATYLQCGPPSKMWGNAPSPADANYRSIAHEYSNDFLFTASDFDATNDWAVTEDDAACTQAISTDTVGGTLLLTNKATTDNNGQQIQLNQESFKMAAGKKLWFEARVKLTAATQLDWFVGLAVTEDITGVANNMPANGIGFQKDDDDTEIDFSSSDNNVDKESDAQGTASTAWVKLGFYCDGGATGALVITPFIDGVAVTGFTDATYATQSEMSPLFMVRNGDGTTQQKMEIDYVRCVQLR